VNRRPGERALTVLLWIGVTALLVMAAASVAVVAVVARLVSL
jgi:hypothetical protein